MFALGLTVLSVLVVGVVAGVAVATPMSAVLRFSVRVGVAWTVLGATDFCVDWLMGCALSLVDAVFCDLFCVGGGLGVDM